MYEDNYTEQYVTNESMKHPTLLKICNEKNEMYSLYYHDKHMVGNYTQSLSYKTHIYLPDYTYYIISRDLDTIKDKSNECNECNECNEWWIKMDDYDSYEMLEKLSSYPEGIKYEKYNNPLLTGYYVSTSCLIWGMKQTTDSNTNFNRYRSDDVYRMRHRYISPYYTNLNIRQHAIHVTVKLLEKYRKSGIVIDTLTNHLKTELLHKGFIESNLEDIPLPEGITLMKGIDYLDAKNKAIESVRSVIPPWCCISGGTFIKYDKNNPFSKAFYEIYKLCSSNTDIDIYLQNMFVSTASITDRIQLSMYPSPLDNIVNFDYPVCKIVLMFFPNGEQKYYYHDSLNKNLKLPALSSDMKTNIQYRIMKYLFKGMRPSTTYEEQIEFFRSIDKTNILGRLYRSMANLDLMRFVFGVNNYPILSILYSQVLGSNYIANLCFNHSDIESRLLLSPYPGYIKTSIDELSKVLNRPIAVEYIYNNNNLLHVYIKSKPQELRFSNNINRLIKLATESCKAAKWDNDNGYDNNNLNTHDNHLSITNPTLCNDMPCFNYNTKARDRERITYRHSIGSGYDKIVTYVNDRVDRTNGCIKRGLLDSVRYQKCMLPHNKIFAKHSNDNGVINLELYTTPELIYSGNNIPLPREGEDSNSIIEKLEGYYRGLLYDEESIQTVLPIIENTLTESINRGECNINPYPTIVISRFPIKGFYEPNK